METIHLPCNFIPKLENGSNSFRSFSLMESRKLKPLSLKLSQSQRRVVSTRASNNGSSNQPEKEPSGESEAQPILSDSGGDGETSPRPRLRLPSKAAETQKITLDDVNPIGLGRKSRQLFDDVWKRLVQLGQLTQPVVDDDYEFIQGPACEFTIPNAEFTTVLVVGATGRVGRVLIRKLLLRGYKVKVKRQFMS